jgi:hypothetical protein
MDAVMAWIGARAPPGQKQLIFAAIGRQRFHSRPIAAHREPCSPACSSTIRTARSRTSGENRADLVPVFSIAPPSEELEPPNPAWFIEAYLHVKSKGYWPSGEGRTPAST